MDSAVDLDLAVLAVRLMDRTKQDIREVADEEGLSIAQLDVLRRLRHHGPTPMRRLAEQMNCEASNLTGLVDRLESGASSSAGPIRATGGCACWR